MRATGIALLAVGVLLVVVGIAAARAGRRRPARRVVVTGQIVRQVGWGRTPPYEVAYPLPDGTWTTTVTRSPLSPGGITTLGWTQGTSVPVHVNIDDPRDARLTPDGSLGVAGFVGLVLGVVGLILGVVGGVLTAVSAVG
ncbi:hypothetical protein [Sanguibacter sp. HDW7]|uniref:DUF3592 domain-containing protein n=1 Tax=Sanguibacter sp. HDW7 TaxID=2714931 RepID=UPI00140A7066|nr:hypothetical protein [Sanguibacter sp. HDW7]QIK83917.1 hypothetical protein G7063_10005 [Sanguibacter sp. HDW7]